MNRRKFIVACATLPLAAALPARSAPPEEAGTWIKIGMPAESVAGCWSEWSELSEFQAVRVAAEAGDVRALDAFPGVARRLSDSARASR